MPNTPQYPALEKLSTADRITIRRPGDPDPGGRTVVYWMQRAQRAIDNPALDCAVEAANALGIPVVIYLAPVPFYPSANLRHYAFLSQGICDIACDAEKRNAGFVLRRYPKHSLAKFLDEVKPALLIGDENPMREPEHWREVVARQVKIPFWTVDADVIVPSRVFGKAQYAAYTMRPRLMKALPEFLIDSENPRAKIPWAASKGIESLPLDADITEGWEIDRSVKPVSAFRGGTREAEKLLSDFVRNKLKGYSERRNHPEDDGTSRLSPYLHFGHIGPITVARAVQHAVKQMFAGAEQRDDFLDQMITWRELAINFVKYNPHYDSIECAEPWARNSLAEHAGDPRDVKYTRMQLEMAETHDDLWNAAQLQMVRGGWMHNYMRMYWAKKILEWSPSPAAAYNTAVYLNDKYELDGRDPNGYAGIAWSIAGKFDRAWFDRPIFGKVRFMSGASARKKFDAKQYISQVQALT